MTSIISAPSQSYDPCVYSCSSKPISWTEVYEIVKGLTSEFQDKLDAAALVGSASPESQESQREGSDLDLLVLWRKPSCPDDLVVRLEEGLRCCDPDWKVVNCLGVVSRRFLGTPVLHLHSMPLEGFLGRSILYRHALTKYRSFLGRPLEYYRPSDVLDVSHLQSDPLGPLELFEKLKSRHESIQAVWTTDNYGWNLEAYSLYTADYLDLCLYATLHSARNVLRCIGQYNEHLPLGCLLDQWVVAGRSNAGDLRFLIQAKADRRAGCLFCSQYRREVEESALSFLEGVLRHNYQADSG